MGIIGWLLRQSPAFRSLVKEFQKHKENTKSSFQKVKRDNRAMAKRILEHEKKIARFERLMKGSEPIKVYIKNRPRLRR